MKKTERPHDEGPATTGLDPRARAARILEGLPAAPGVAIGRALVLERDSMQIFRAVIAPEEIDAEVARLGAALEQSKQQVALLRDKLRVQAGAQYSFIFDAHLMFLDDRRLVGEATNTIRDQSVNAEWALSKAFRSVEETFSRMEDPYLRERGHDVADVHSRVQRNLAGTAHLDLADLTQDVIIVAHSLPPSEAASLHHEHVAGFITEVGGQTSHTAIVAKSLGIPAVVGVENALSIIAPDSLIAIDGRLGRVLVSPNEAALRRYARRRKAYFTREQSLSANRDQPAETKDGVRVVLRANIELVEELESAREHGAEGIGLYRSEFLFLATAPDLPTEEDHHDVYARLVQASAPSPVTIRTLDLGGEKYFHDVLTRGESNPILGLRALRFCLSRPDIIEPQLRAILRASVHGPTRVMFPLITCVEEILAIREVLERVKRELRLEGVPFSEDIPVGIMIEVPSVALIAEIVARHVDFFAIGTNDLIQYTLAVDRGNEHVSHLFQPLHPAVLRLLDMTAKAAHAAGIGLSLCGEMAATPRHAALLVGLGIEELSMDPVSIPFLKEALRAVKASDLRAVAKEALLQETAADVDALLTERLGDSLPPGTASVRAKRRAR